MKSYVLLTVFSLLLFVPGLFSLPVIDRDEAHFAQATRQMMQTGNYFQIRFQDTTRFQKPPGINWLQAASVWLFSNSEQAVIWPYRIPSLLGALLSIWLTFFFARRFVGDRVAMLASGFLATSLLLVVETHMAVIDASLLSSVVMMQGALWVIYKANRDHKKAHWGWGLLFWFAMSYGFLLKGVTPLVGFLTAITLCVMERRWLKGLHFYAGLLLFVVLSLAWAIQVDAAEHTHYLWQMFHKDLLPKLQGGVESHGAPPLFHLLSLPVTFWPASLFLWRAAVYGYKQRKTEVVRFLLAWILPTWIFFELMPTKLPQYVLPTFPAIALLCALSLMDTTSLKIPRFGARLLQVLWGVISIALALFLLVISYFLLHQVTVISVLSSVTLIIMAMISLFFAYKGAFNKASVAVLLTGLLSFPLIFEGVLPSLQPVWISKQLTSLLQQQKITTTSPILAFGFSEPSLVFYLNTKGVVLLDEWQGIGDVNKEYPDSLLLINQSRYTELEQRWGPLTQLGQVHGYNYNSGRWITLYLAQQKK